MNQVTTIAEEISSDITALKNNIIENRKIANEEGTWLFLTTLGCWSAPSKLFQIAALFIAVCIFLARAIDRQKVVGLMPPKIARLEIEAKINHMPEGDEKKARLYDLGVLQQTEIKLFSSGKKGLPFLLSWGFYSASLLYSMFQLTGFSK